MTCCWGLCLTDSLMEIVNVVIAFCLAVASAASAAPSMMYHLSHAIIIIIINCRCLNYNLRIENHYFRIERDEII